MKDDNSITGTEVVADPPDGDAEMKDEEEAESQK